MSKIIFVLPFLAVLGACSGQNSGNVTPLKSEAAETAQVAQLVEDPAPKRKWFQLKTKAKSAETEKAESAQKDSVATAIDEVAQSTADEKPKRKWFGFGKKNNADSETASTDTVKETPTVSPATPVAFGEVRKLCGKDARVAGKAIAAIPGGVTIIDSNPKSSGARAFYVKGLDDRCTRQINAALVEVGPPSTYEFMRFNGPKSLKLGSTDSAYDKIKSKTCGVATSKPCGNKISKLERNTAFITYYQTFGSSRQWANLLIHKGDLIAADVKGK